jgi:DNA-directed RNA polymerase specialized sigma24 family protein
MNGTIIEIVSTRQVQGHFVAEEDEPATCSSFQHFVLAQQMAVYTFCYRLLGSAKTAEMAAQTAFQDIYPQFPAASLVTVLAAARRRCHELLRREGCPGEMAADDIQHLYNYLPLPEREVMALQYGCKLALNEVAVVLDTFCAAIRLTLQQARWRAANLERARFDNQSNYGW